MKLFPAFAQWPHPCSSWLSWHSPWLLVVCSRLTSLAALPKATNLQCKGQEEVTWNQWIFQVLVIGGSDYITPQKAIYKWYILPIGGLYATYHLLGEPKTAIDWRTSLASHFSWRGYKPVLIIASTCWSSQRMKYLTSRNWALPPEKKKWHRAPVATNNQNAGFVVKSFEYLQRINTKHTKHSVRYVDLLWPFERPMSARQQCQKVGQHLWYEFVARCRHKTSTCKLGKELANLFTQVILIDVSMACIN